MKYPITIRIGEYAAQYEEIKSFGERVGSLFICTKDYRVCNIYSIPLGPNPQLTAWERDENWVARIATEKIKEIKKESKR